MEKKLREKWCNLICFNYLPIQIFLSRVAEYHDVRNKRETKKNGTRM